MTVNLLKRLGSSVHSFRLTLSRILEAITDTIKAINEYEESGYSEIAMLRVDGDDIFDMDDQNSTLFTIGKKIKIDLADMDYWSWRKVLEKDRDTLLLSFWRNGAFLTANNHQHEKEVYYGIF